MRIFIYILVCCVLFSCKNANEKEMILEAPPVMDNMEIVAEEVIGNTTSETFKFETITRQKLQELLELEELAQEYPNNTFIKAQIEGMTDGLEYSGFWGFHKVVTIKTLAKPEIVSDSVQKIRVFFTSEGFHGNILEDSITATITSRMFILDGVEQISRKVVFEE